MTTPQQSTAVATQQQKLIPRFAERYGVDADKLLHTLRLTAFRQQGDITVSNEEMMALLVVADQYKLNPFTREIFAFFDRQKGVIPIVSVDGWSRIINSHDQYDGIEFRYSDQIVTMPDGKPCPEWCEVVIYHKDRSRPTVVREYLDEVYIGKRGNPPKSGPWQTHTKRFLRHKTLIQGARVAFGFSGIYDEDEASRIIEVQVVDSPTTTAGGANVGDLQEALKKRAERNAEPVDAEFTDAAGAGAPPLQPGDDGYIAPVTDDGDNGGSSDGDGDGEPDPVEVFRQIQAADTDQKISDLIDRIATITDIDARKDLTRKALARKGELMKQQQ